MKLFQQLVRSGSSVPVSVLAITMLAACSSSESDTTGGDVDAPAIATIDLAELEDKIRGGWAGQMIGVSYGAPTEFRYLGRIIPEDELPEWTPEQVRNAINQDDLYVDMTFVKVLDEKGWDATTDDYGAAFRDSEYALWHANYAARRALRRGTPATLSGSPEVNPHTNDIDFQIEADFVGLLAPGMPQTATALAQDVGRVMNDGDGLLGGVFVGGLYSAAFFEDDPRAIVETGLALLPPDSWYGRIIADTLHWSAENPDDWTATWQLIEDAWATGEVCPQGAGVPFNIDAHLNGAYIAVGLLYGGGDFEQTMKISTRAGQDSDCNPASAAGVLGVVMGYEAIPEQYKAGIAEIAQENFAFTEYSFESIVATNMEKAIEAAERAGGRLEGDTLQVPLQTAEVAEVQLFEDYGRAKERIEPADERMKLTGGWQLEEDQQGPWKRSYAFAEQSGAEAEVTFEGTGVILTSLHRPEGGLVQIWLDGEDQGTFDACSEEDPSVFWSSKGDEAVWHRFGLAPGEHTLAIRVLGVPYVRDDFESTSSGFWMQDVVVFDGQASAD